ncbi:MAG: MAPEG family protein [Granulosicoccus sp.]
MIVEVKVLALAALWQYVQFVLMAVPVNKELGTDKTLSSRDAQKLGGSIQSQVTARTARLIRALENHFEALILFTIAVVAVALSGQSSAVTVSCAWIYLASRVVYVAAYAFDWVPWRSLIWAAGFGATAIMLIAVII